MSKITGLFEGNPHLEYTLYCRGAASITKIKDMKEISFNQWPCWMNWKTDKNSHNFGYGKFLVTNDAFDYSNYLYDLKENLAGAFDIVFTSYGVIGWLPDLDNWASIIAHYLKPSGTFYMAEFHPVVWMFNDEFTKIEYAYENKEVIVIDNAGTYTDREADISGKEYSWNHSISEILNCLL